MQLVVDGVQTGIVPEDLVRWLDKEIAQTDIVRSRLRAYLSAVVSYLLHERHVPLDTLARMRFVLAQQIGARIADLRQSAAQRRFRQLVLDGGWTVQPDWKRPFTFQPGRYPAHAATRYDGRWQFFPDFVVELLVGRVAVIEYKGAHLRTDPYEMEKRQVASYGPNAAATNACPALSTWKTAANR